MRNNSYWKKRADLRMNQYHKNSDKTILLINKAYDKAIKDINEDINKIFWKYVLDSNLTEKEARELLNSDISKKELDSIRKRIRYIQDEDIKRYMLAELNANAYKARITRLEALKESVCINSKIVADTELKHTTKLYTENIKEAYYANLFDIQKGLGVGFNVAEMSTKTIQEILKNNWSGKHFSERIWRNTDVLSEQLKEVVTSGLMSGKSSKRIAAELQELTDYGKFAAERLVRTETTYISNMAEIESYKECGIEKYRFLATLDSRTSKQCRAVDGKIVEVSKAVSGENLPPLHPYCRSTTIAYFEETENFKRRARDPETDKNYILPGDMNYKEWYDKFVVDKYGKDKADAFEKMIKNKASDRKQFKAFKEYLGKDSPKTLKSFQELKYNNSNEWNLVKDYVKSRRNNMISAFTPYSQYKEYKTIIDSDIVGLITNNGIKITGQSKHFIERVFGTNADTQTNRPRSGVEISDIKDAILNGSIRIRKNDPNSIKFITDKCMVSVNPNTGVLIQTNP